MPEQYAATVAGRLSLDTICTTIARLAMLARKDQESDRHERETNTHHSLVAIRELAELGIECAAEFALMERVQANANADPIFAAIDAHRTAVEAHDRAVRELPDDSRDLEAFADADAAALKALCTTAPTTTAGLSALIAYLRPLYEAGGLAHGEFRDGRTNDLFRTLEIAATRLLAMNPAA